MCSRILNNVNRRIPRLVDLRSDTKSLPTLEMKNAMFSASLGDDVFGEDPTINELENRAAKLFEKEAGLFVTSGTMSNLLAMMVHCNSRGAEVIMGDQAHCHKYENGGAATIAGISMNKIKNLPDGTLCLKEVKENIRGHDIHEPITKLVMIENTHNVMGGAVLPLDFIENLSKLCKQHSVKIHMDGARVFNAAEYLKVPVARVTRDVDSIGFCLSKGLCCPVGSVLLGTKNFINEARRLRKALGGGMRQAGILAAAGLFALDNVVPKLGNDHAHTKQIADAINQLSSSIFSVNLKTLHTNILNLQIEDPKNKINVTHLNQRLSEITDKEIADGIVDSEGNGVIVKGSFKPTLLSKMRFVIYSSITDELTELGIKKLIYVMKELESKL